jgi:hypothetical protein
MNKNTPSKVPAKKKSIAEKPVVKKEEDLGLTTTYPISFTRAELAHIRDLFSIKMPPDMDTTLSEALASNQDRAHIETKLWKKFVKTFSSASIPLEDESPDFTLVPSGPIALNVVQFEVTDEQISED